MKKQFKKSIAVENEMVRLNTTLLQPLSDVSCHTSHITIALLNVRSILAKLDQITTSDVLVYCASVRLG